MPKTKAQQKAQNKYMSDKKRVSLVFTQEEYQQLKDMAEENETTIHGLVRAKLGLERKEREYKRTTPLKQSVANRKKMKFKPKKPKA